MPETAGPDLVALAQRGEVDAIGALFDQHYEAIFRYLASRVAEPQAAEDLTGEVFKRMLTGLPQYRPMGLPFRAWLFRIAHNLLVDHYRKENSHVVVNLQDIEHQAQGGDDPATAVEQTLALEHVHQALAELGSPQRDVLTLRFLIGLSPKEVALALGKTEDAVKALQRRGLVALRLTLALEEK